MGAISYTNTFSDGDSTNLGVKIQQNFADVTDVLNGSVDATNVSSSANISVTSLTLSTSGSASVIQNSSIALDQMIDLNSGKSLKITDSGDNVLLEIKDTGEIVIPVGKTSYFPIGTILFFEGTWTDNVTIPGWYKCDGNNGTPDLTDKFIRAEGSSGNTGGSDDAINPTHTHTATVGNQSDDHDHAYSFSTSITQFTDSTHAHEIDLTSWANYKDDKGRQHHGLTAGTVRNLSNFGASGATMEGDAHTHTFSWTSDTESTPHNHSVSIENAGDGEDGTGKNVPSYYTLIPIMRVS